MANKQTTAAHGGFPWKQLIGFVLSIVLTLFALWIALYTDLSITMILIIIFGFAFLQAALQLLMFMHMTESSSKGGITGRVQTGNILFAAFIAIVTVIGSVWVLSAGHAEHDKHDTPKTEHNMEHDSSEHGEH
jgi:cytochrome aa3-600 menaquinol oxidase subunit IV